MENLVVSTFQDAVNASEGLKKLQELDGIGDIIIYNVVMIRKTAESQFDLLFQDGPDYEGRPALGALGGSVIGAIGGPLRKVTWMLSRTLLGAPGAGDAGNVFA